MKVQEKDSDRRAEVHIHVQERVEELAEYGQYVDANDGALCCYVPVNEGDVIKITGRFHGTTLSTAHDLVIDGVLRKAQNTISKNVRFQKSVRLDLDTALCQIEGDGETNLIDTMMKLVPVGGFDFTQKNEFETIGTIELHLYVFRTFGADHPLDSEVFTYLDEEGEELDEGEENEEKQDEKKEAELNGGEKIEHEEGTQEPEEHKTRKEQNEKAKRASYKSFAPDLMIDFEKNVQEMDRKTANAWKKKLQTNRPSKEPWAIFRFHYRRQDAIDAIKLEQTHNPRTRGKGEEPHVLALNAVPALLQVAGAKPDRPRNTASTRASTQTPLSSTPFTPRTNSPFVKRPSSPLPQHPLATPVEETPSETKTTVASEPSSHTSPANPTESLPARASPAPTTTTTLLKRPREPSCNDMRDQAEAVKARRARIAEQHSELDLHLEQRHPAQLRAERERLRRELETLNAKCRKEERALREDQEMLERFRREKGEKQ